MTGRALILRESEVEGMGMGDVSLHGEEGPTTLRDRLLTRRALLQAGVAGSLAVTATAFGTFPAEIVRAAGPRQKAWRQLSPRSSPTSRAYAAIASDLERGNVILFGGLGAPDDTWVWQGSDWHLQELLRSPSPRAGAAMTYDPITQKVLLFGGLGRGAFMDDSWLWDGASWTAISPPVHLSLIHI